jgi:muramoyltetrapeptide carboxypeptidase
VRYPAPLVRGDVIGVTSPSSGVGDNLRPRLEFCIEHLRRLGFEVMVGQCMDGARVTSATASERAGELTDMLLDPRVRAVVPPWGGELAIDLLPLIDFEKVARAEPTWVVGYSDISTLQVPLTMLTGIATLHGPNLMDTPFHVPEPLLHWLDVAGAPPGGTLMQGATSRRQESWPDFQTEPEVRDMALTVPCGWKALNSQNGDVRVTGRLLGGCLETLAMLPGTPYGDVNAFADRYSPDGLLLYLENAESNAVAVSRMLHHLRFAGWFDRANGILIGRTSGPAKGEYSQVEALHHALGDLPIPVVYDLDFGHVPPQLALINGSLAVVELEGSGTSTLSQQLV